MTKSHLMGTITYLIASAIFQPIAAQNQNADSTIRIEILAERPEANYDFAKNWQYKPHIIRLENGQLRCTLCPEEALPFIGKNGKVKKKNLAAYYGAIDTGHIFQTMLSETDIPGFKNPQFANGKFIDETSFELSDSIGEGATFRWKVNDRNVEARLSLSNPDGSVETFNATSGQVSIGLPGWLSGRMEGRFELVFSSQANPSRQYHWKGLLVCPITD